MSVARAAKLILSLQDEVTAKSKKVTGSLRGIETQIAAIDQRMNMTRGRLVDAAIIGVGAFNALAGPTKAAMAFEEAMADIAKVVEFEQPEQFQTMKDDLLELSKTIPMAVEELAAIAAAAGQVGMAANDIVPFTELVAKAGVAWGVTGDQAGEALAKIQTALGLTNEQTGSYADAINHLSNSMASTAPDLVDYARRVGAIGRQFGLSDEQTLAFGSAMIASGAQSEVAATSFRNMGRALVRGESATKRQSAAFATLGMEATKVAGDMQRDAVGTINAVLGAIRELPREMQASIISDLFGDEARALTPLIENSELLAEALGYVAEQTEYAGSVQREFQKRSETTSNDLELLKNRARAASIAFGDALLPRVKSTAGVLGDFADRAASLIKANQQLIANVASLGAGFLTFRIGALAASYATLYLRRELLATAAMTIKLGAALKAMTVAPLVAGLMAARRGLIGFTAAASISGTVSAFGTAMASIGKSAIGILNPIRLARAALWGLRSAMMLTGVGAALTAVSSAVYWISENLAGLKTMFGGIAEGFSAAFDPVAPILDPIISSVGSIIGSLQGMLGPVDESGERWRQWGMSIGSTLGGAATAVAEGVQQIVDLVIGLPGRVMSTSSAMVAAGSALIESLWDGAVAKFNEFLAWVREIPSRIVNAIGSIDLSGIIRWPSMPRIFGGGDEPAPAASSSAPAAATAIAGKRERGGPVQRGLTYIVGEAGPELFTADRSGEIISNDRLTGMAASLQGNNYGGARIELTVHQTFKLSGIGDIEAVARRAAETVVNKTFGALDDALTRSQQLTFGGLRPYDD